MHGQTPPIIHRDIKPENILLNNKDEILVADFGLSNFLLEASRQTSCGTPDYMGPEMFGENGHDTRLDYWSLGVFIYELLAESKPFVPTADDKEKYKGKKFEEVIALKIQEVDYSFPVGFPEGAKDIVQ